MITDLLVDVRNVSKTYAGSGVPALADVSLQLFKGEVVALLGVNGAGKTTLSSIIATLHPSTSGTLIFDGKDVCKNLYTYRRIIGLCPQKPNFEKNLTVREHLVFAGRYFGMTRDEINRRVDQLLHSFGLMAYADASPNILSGGYKQRLLIARALVHRPSLVILDEPTVGLDIQIRHQLWEIIRQLKNDGVTVLLTTHYLEEAEALSDRVCILDKGRILRVDKAENLKKLYKKGSLQDVFLALMHENGKE